ncbi:MAG: ABC transporter ATP-binding protein, partial [Pseudomonadota bacterium]
TTLLETLATLRTPASGAIRINGRSLADVTARERAGQIGLMPQILDAGFDQPVVDRVALGRYRQGGLWQWRAEADRQAADDALAAVDMAHLASHSTTTLSGGERQRMALAMLLAQAPDVMLLDEPFSALDPAHRTGVSRVLRAQRDAGRIVVFSVHDPSLAARLADRVVLLSGRGDWEAGPTDELLTEARLSALYGTPFTRLEDGDGRAAFLPHTG